MTADAYDVLGPIVPFHPASEAGLTAYSDDDDVLAIAAVLLADPEPCPFDPATLGPALVTWRDDLRYLEGLQDDEDPVDVDPLAPGCTCGRQGYDGAVLDCAVHER